MTLMKLLHIHLTNLRFPLSTNLLSTNIAGPGTTALFRASVGLAETDAGPNGSCLFEGRTQQVDNSGWRSLGDDIPEWCFLLGKSNLVRDFAAPKPS